MSDTSPERTPDTTSAPAESVSSTPDTAEALEVEAAEVDEGLQAGINLGLSVLQERVDRLGSGAAEEAERIADVVSGVENPEDAVEAERVVGRIVENRTERSNRLFGENSEQPEEQSVWVGLAAYVRNIIDYLKGWLYDLGLLSRDSEDGANGPSASSERMSTRNIESGTLRDPSTLNLPPDQVNYYNYAIEASREYGFPEDRGVPTLWGLFHSESNFDPTLMNRGSMDRGTTATGLGQFTNRTWRGFMEDQGVRMLELGIIEASDLIDLEDRDGSLRRENPRLMVFATAWYLNNNFNRLKRLGFAESWYDPNIGFMLYMMHHAGPGDAPKFLAYLQSGGSDITDNSLAALQARDETLLADMSHRDNTLRHYYGREILVDRFGPDEYREAEYYFKTAERIDEYAQRFVIPSSNREREPIAASDTLIIGASYSEGMASANDNILATQHRGESSGFFARNFEADLDRHNPRQVVLMATPNDVWQVENPSYETIEDNYREMIQKARARNITPYLCTMVSMAEDESVRGNSRVTPEIIERVEDLNETIIDLGIELGVEVIRLDSKHTSRSLHVDSGTYRVLGDYILEQVALYSAT